MIATLSSRVAVLVAALTLAAVALVTAVVAVTTSRSLTRALDQQAQTQTAILKAMNVAGAKVGSWPETAPAARAEADRYGVRVVVTSADLQPYVDTGSGDLPQLVGALDPFGPLGVGGAGDFDSSTYVRSLRDCFDARRIAYEDTGSALGPVPDKSADPQATSHCYSAAKSAAAGKAPTGVKKPALLFISSTAPATIPWALLALVGAGIVGAAVLAAVPLSRALTRPLTRIADASEAIRRGDLDARVYVESPAEVADLAKSFNAMATELALAEERRQRLTSDIAHELRSPLTNMRNLLDAFEDGVLEPTPQELATLSAETWRLSRLVQDLAVVAALDEHTLRLRPERVDLDELVGSVLEARRALAVAAGVDMSRSGAGHIVTIDPARVAQIIGNLVDNALRWTPPGGQVAIHVDADGDWVVARVEDSGPGVAAADLERVFDRLWRADEARTLGQGHGLGLSIARGLAAAHGGTLTVANRLEGGARFTLRLPRG